MSRRDPRGDNGSSTVMALGVVAALLSLTLGGLAVLSAVHALHVARSAADLAALAAAGQYQEQGDPAAACREAERIALRHEASITSCKVSGAGVITLMTSAPVAYRLAGAGPDTAEGRARAGPAP